MGRSLRTSSTPKARGSSRPPASRTRGQSARARVWALLAPLHGRGWVQRIDVNDGPAPRLFRAKADGERIVELTLPAGTVHVRVVFDVGHDELRSDLVDQILETARSIVRELIAESHAEEVRTALAQARLTREAREAEVERATQATRAAESRYADAQRRLLERDRLNGMSAMFASVVHDIRSPLTALVWNLRILEEWARKAGSSEDAEIADVFDDTKLACELIDGVLESLRTFASGSGAPRTFDACEVVRTVTRLFRWHVAQRGVRFVHELRGDPRVWGSPSETCQVLLNLLANAADASPRGGTVRLDVRQDGGVVRFRVLDEGPGIPEEEREQVFAPFHTTKGDGLGIGLTVARTMARRHGGDLVVVPRAEQERGACLELRLQVERPREAELDEVAE